MTERNDTTKVQVFAYTALNDEHKKLVDMAKEAILALCVSYKL